MIARCARLYGPLGCGAGWESCPTLGSRSVVAGPRPAGKRDATRVCPSVYGTGFETRSEQALSVRKSRITQCRGGGVSLASSGRDGRTAIRLFSSDRAISCGGLDHGFGHESQAGTARHKLLRDTRVNGGPAETGLRRGGLIRGPACCGYAGWARRGQVGSPEDNACRHGVNAARRPYERLGPRPQ